MNQKNAIKFAMFATLILPACAQIHAASKSQKVIDTTPDALRSWLDFNGYSEALITGRRTEDCEPRDLIGYGVIIKKQIEDKVVPVSAVVCQNYDGEMRLKEDL